MVEGEAKAVAEAAMVENMATTGAMGMAAAASGAVWMVVLSFSAPSWLDVLLLSQVKALEARLPLLVSMPVLLSAIE